MKKTLGVPCLAVSLFLLLSFGGTETLLKAQEPQVDDSEIGPSNCDSQAIQGCSRPMATYINADHGFDSSRNPLKAPLFQQVGRGGYPV